MGEKNLWSKVGLIVVLIAMCAWYLRPLNKDFEFSLGENLKWGIDLAGGHSLLFAIDDSGLDSYERENLPERMMNTLKKRVDPQGTRNLIWRPIGRNRLEIQMPRPPKEQQQNRQAYEATRQALADTNITEAEIRHVLELSGEAQASTVEKLVGPYEGRRDAFNKLIRTEEAYRQHSEEFQQLREQREALQAELKAEGEPEAPTEEEEAEAQPADETPEARLAKLDEQLSRKAREADAALNERNEVIQKLLDTNLQVGVLEDLLELGRNNDIRIKGVTDLKAGHPDLAPLIDRMADAFDNYSGARGALDDPEDLMRLLRGAGILEFRILAKRNPQNPTVIESENPAYNDTPVQKYVEQLQRFGPRRQGDDPFQWFIISQDNERDWNDTRLVLEEYAGAKYVLAHATEDMGMLEGESWSLGTARTTIDNFGRNAVGFELSRGARDFAQLTGNNINYPLCIFLDDEAISSANIKSQIYDSGEISGNFSKDYVDYLVRTLNAGSLPGRLIETPLHQKSIGATLGETNRVKGQMAIGLALAIVVVFMVIYYGYNGFIADIALLLNLIITLGVMSFLQATFTLAGIAGLVLTLGMAVDANVLIFERIREELSRGISVKMAVKLGYEKAFSAILDSNVTTILTAVILGSLGSEEIKGFGLTLGIGLCTSMFTALFVTRQYFHIMLPASLNQDETKKAWLMTGILVVAGGVIAGCARAFVDPKNRADSTLYGLGEFLAWAAVTVALMMGSLWLFRFAYRGLGHQKANRLPMLRLLSAPKIDWMKKYKVFWTISAIMIIGGIIFDSAIDRKEVLDIEFLGGTSVQVQLNSEHRNLTDNDIREFIVSDGPEAKSSVTWLRKASDLLADAQVTRVGDHGFNIATGGDLNQVQLEALLLPVFEDKIVRGGITEAENGVDVQFKLPAEKEDETGAPAETAKATTVEDVKNYLAQTVAYLGGRGEGGTIGRLKQCRITVIQADQNVEDATPAFEIVTTETRRALMAQALLAPMRDILEVTPPVEATVVVNPARTPADGVFPIPQTANTLGDVLDVELSVDIPEFKGGVAFVFDRLDPAQTPNQVANRIRTMRQQPDFEETISRGTRVIALAAVDPNVAPGPDVPCTKVAVIVNDPTVSYAEGADNTAWETEFALSELNLIEAALATGRSLERVTQFDAQIAGEATTKAIIAIILSLLAIAGYLWVRFGSVQFGLAGIIALFHDVAITLTCVLACHFIHDTAIGKLLGLKDFRIDLAMIAAFLTIVGYSINDTIVIFDRIRENRGRLATISPTLINNSLNQTLSRTLITSLTTFMVVVVMYIAGGEGIHGFAFAMIVGTVSGTYSTIAIATPMLNHPRAMWVVTTALAAIVGAGLVLLIGLQPVRIFLWIVIGLAVAYSLYRQLGPSRAVGHQPATA